MVAGPLKNEDVSRTLDQYDLGRVGNNMYGRHTAYFSALEFGSNISPRRLNILLAFLFNACKVRVAWYVVRAPASYSAPAARYQGM